VCEKGNGKGRGKRGTGAPGLAGPCAGGEGWRTRVMTRNAAVVAAVKGDGDTGARGERESEGYAIGAGPWQSARSSVGSRPG
jgi:hypothetical protein